MLKQLARGVRIALLLHRNGQLDLRFKSLGRCLSKITRQLFHALLGHPELQQRAQSLLADKTLQVVVLVVFSTVLAA